jgi:hypothetical protein
MCLYVCMYVYVYTSAMIFVVCTMFNFILLRKLMSVSAKGLGILLLTRARILY